MPICERNCTACFPSLSINSILTTQVLLTTTTLSHSPKHGPDCVGGWGIDNKQTHINQKTSRWVKGSVGSYNRGEVRETRRTFDVPAGGAHSEERDWGEPRASRKGGLGEFEEQAELCAGQSVHSGRRSRSGLRGRQGWVLL